MDFNNIVAIIKSVFLKNYCNFEGRATRAEFWWFFLFNFIVGLIFSGLTQVGGTFFYVLSCIYSLGVLLPQLGLGVRRLHDINKSGWWWLICLIPVVGAIILIVWWAKEGDPTENQYGAVPTTPTAE